MTKNELISNTYNDVLKIIRHYLGSQEGIRNIIKAEDLMHYMITAYDYLKIHTKKDLIKLSIFIMKKRIVDELRRNRFNNGVYNHNKKIISIHKYNHLPDKYDHIKEAEDNDAIDFIKKTYKDYFNVSSIDKPHVQRKNKIGQIIIKDYVIPTLSDKDYKNIRIVCENNDINISDFYNHLRSHKMKLYLTKAGIINDT